MTVVPTLNRKKTFGEQVLHNIPYILMCLPAVVITIIFTYIPMYGILINFKDFNVIDGIIKSPWVGFENFRYLFASDDMYILLRNTIGYNVAKIFFVNFVGGIWFALLLYEIQSKIASKIYQTSMLITSFISMSCIMYIIVLFLNDADTGIVNSILISLGKSPVRFFSKKAVWPFVIVFTHLWMNAGQAALYFFAALLAIDPCLFEAANLDGANRLKQIWYISIPELMPMGCLVLITQIGSLFSSAALGLEYLISQKADGSVIDVLNVLAMYSYNLMMKGDMGVSAATGLATSVVSMILTNVINAIVRKINAENALF